MRLGWLALPLVLASASCAPVRNFQEAARTLRFTLDRVEPRLQLAFPLESSRVAFRIVLGVDNPSEVTFRIRGFAGNLALNTGVEVHPMGHLDLVQPLELPPGGKASLAVELAFSYGDLRDHWGALQGALRGSATGSWTLQGSLGLEAYGLPIQLPIRATRSFGAAP